MHRIIKTTTALVALSGASFAIAGLPALGQSAGSTTPLPVFNVISYRASASNTAGRCSAVAGTQTLTGCVNTFDFNVGEGIHIVGGGPVSAVKAVTAAPIVAKQGTATGSHSNCYEVVTADPLEGVSAPSPQACVGNQPALSFPAAWNQLTLADTNVGPSPAFLWYVSQDGGPFQLITVAGYGALAMDVGQRPGTRGGWPNNVPAGSMNFAKNEDFYSTITAVKGNQITIADALPASITNAQVLHDDTAAFQAAIDAASAAGGGTVQFPAGTYLIQRPVFVVTSSGANPVFTNALKSDAWYSVYSYLNIPSNSTGHIHLQGTGNGSVINVPPDHGSMATLLAAGFRQRPNDYTGVIKMQNVDKGATKIVLADGSPTFNPGDDIWLYSGSFSGAPCQDVKNTPNECHFSELNTVASVDGNSIGLVYPTSKRYFDDGIDSFGLVKMPTVPHDLAMKNMLINTTNPVLTTGMVYGLTIDSVFINGFVGHGPYGGGFKRDVTIQNSGWGFGTGDVSYGATDEYDQFTNVSFINNFIVGYAAPGAEMYSSMARIYGTEGSSGFTFKNNQLYNASIFLDQTTDDVITGNQMQDSIIKMGTAYGNNPFSNGPNHDLSFDSYDSQVAGDVDTNTMNITSTFLAPFLLQLGHFNSATVTGNTFTYLGNQTITGIEAYSGSITNNTFNMPGVGVSIPLALIPDQTALNPAAPFNVQGNTYNISGFSVSNYITDPGFTDIAPICIQNNTYHQVLGLPQLAVNPGSVTTTCSN